MVICCASFITRFALHFTQYASAAIDPPSLSDDTSCLSGWRLFPGSRDIPSTQARIPEEHHLARQAAQREYPGMDSIPSFVSAEQIWALRGERARPARLRGLYVSGNLDALAGPTVAIVGSRAASEQGCRIAWRFAAALGQAGICVISGLALGIDSAAHRGSLSVGAATVGILGGGHERFFPKRNVPLAESMLAKGGAVLSPFAPDEPAMPSRFLQRNGVIAALSDAVVVVEAAARSGALNTAAWAASANVPVLAVPGDIDRPKVAGCHALIRDGATLARNVEDILEAIGALRHPRGKASVQPCLPFPPDSLPAQLTLALADEPQYLEELAAQHTASTADILSALARLSLAGIVRERDDGAYLLSN